MLEVALKYILFTSQGPPIKYAVVRHIRDRFGSRNCKPIFTNSLKYENYKNDVQIKGARIKIMNSMSQIMSYNTTIHFLYKFSFYHVWKYTTLVADKASGNEIWWRTDKAKVR